MHKAFNKQICLLIVGTLVFSGLGIVWTSGTNAGPVGAQNVESSGILDAETVPVSTSYSEETIMEDQMASNPFLKLDPRLTNQVVSGQKDTVKVYVATYDVGELA